MSVRRKASVVIMFRYVFDFLYHLKVLYQSKTVLAYYSNECQMLNNKLTLAGQGVTNNDLAFTCCDTALFLSIINDINITNKNNVLIGLTISLNSVDTLPLCS